MAQIMNNSGKIVGFDIHEHKLSLVKRSAKRLGINIIEVDFSDAKLERPAFFEKADKVLVDAPCSGLGIIRRKPDIKWNRENDSLEDLVALQNRILKVSSKYVKPGGILVYSTCTINDKENIKVVQAFLEENPNFEKENIADYFPESLKKDTMQEGYVQFFPNVDNIDGFFIFKMKRKY
jgi:16S rRNA (cytosine967-C5)-methyltransferase